jgi:hypothetical protein
VTATIVHFTSSTPSSSSGGEGSIEHVTVTAGSKEVASPEFSPESDAAFFSTMRNSLPSDFADRVVFESDSVSSVLDASLERAKTEVSQNPKNGGDIIVLGRGNVSETSSSGSGPVCLGVAAEKVLGANLRASVLVLLARGPE